MRIFTLADWVLAAVCKCDYYVAIGGSMITMAFKFFLDGNTLSRVFVREIFVDKVLRCTMHMCRYVKENPKEAN